MRRAGIPPLPFQMWMFPGGDDQTGSVRSGLIYHIFHIYEKLNVLKGVGSYPQGGSLLLLFISKRILLAATTDTYSGGSGVWWTPIEKGQVSGGHLFSSVA